MAALAEDQAMAALAEDQAMAAPLPVQPAHRRNLVQPSSLNRPRLVQPPLNRESSHRKAPLLAR